MTAGLRELKKQQTRQAISDTATRLFLERGFEAVTIAEIAAAAQVAKMTVTNYFPRKEDLALDYHEPFTAALAHTVADRPEGESALAALRREYLAAVERHDPAVGFTGPEFARMIADSPALTARLRELHDQREDALADVLAADVLGADVLAADSAADPAADPGDLTPRAVAALLTAVHRTLFQQVLDLTRTGRTNEEIATAATRSAHQVFGLLEASLGDYAVR
ncbi:TetR family transcriptional regulator [Streptomyces sparsogenes]|uniref:TetR/AcrR family transcriptional regulator n=1 Tax=Streptomyces sparsogenes TaxID=67365 RepID=UPI003403833E